MNRLDEELFLVWPRVMAAMGEPGRAQTLFERALEYHPRSLRILTAYAEVEAQQGDADMARELHERALALDEEDGMATLINRWVMLLVDSLEKLLLSTRVQRSSIACKIRCLTAPLNIILYLLEYFFLSSDMLLFPCGSGLPGLRLRLTRASLRLPGSS